MAESEQQIEQMAQKVVEDRPKRKVLISVDGSKHSIYAFEWFAENMYHKDTDHIILAHCGEIELPTGVLMGSPATMYAMVEDYENRVKKIFETFKQLTTNHNIKPTFERIHEHKPGEAIVKAAEQLDADLIVCGSRGLGTLRRTIMGSCSDYILHHAHVPVIVVKHEDEHHKLKKH